eukprot:102286_1
MASCHDCLVDFLCGITFAFEFKRFWDFDFVCFNSFFKFLFSFSIFVEYFFLLRVHLFFRDLPYLYRSVPFTPPFFLPLLDSEKLVSVGTCVAKLFKLLRFECTRFCLYCFDL